MAATAAKRTTVRLSSGISANILDFGIPQKRVLTETPAMETSGKAGGGEVPTCQTARGARRAIRASIRERAHGSFVR